MSHSKKELILQDTANALAENKQKLLLELQIKCKEILLYRNILEAECADLLHDMPTEVADIIKEVLGPDYTFNVKY